MLKRPSAPLVAVATSDQLAPPSVERWSVTGRPLIAPAPGRRLDAVPANVIVELPGAVGGIGLSSLSAGNASGRNAGSSAVGKPSTAFWKPPLTRKSTNRCAAVVFGIGGFWNLGGLTM